MAETVQDPAGSIEIKTTLTMKVTDLAREKLMSYLPEDKTLDDVGVRVGVQPGGCSGASYQMEFAEGAKDGEVTLVSNGVKLFVDPSWAQVLNGVTVDFVDELMGGGFKVHNPNASNSCGCGKSFSA